MKYEVRLIAMDLNTREYITERTETIDTEENELFRSCNAHPLLGPILVESICESFWNIPSRKEVVKVIGVKKITRTFIPLDEIDYEKSIERSIRVIKENTELTSSMAKEGLTNPITLLKRGEKYIILDGLLRYISAKKLGWYAIPAILK